MKREWVYLGLVLIVVIVLAIVSSQGVLFSPLSTQRSGSTSGGGYVSSGFGECHADAESGLCGCTSEIGDCRTNKYGKAFCTDWGEDKDGNKHCYETTCEDDPNRGCVCDRELIDDDKCVN